MRIAACLVTGAFVVVIGCGSPALDQPTGQPSPPTQTTAARSASPSVMTPINTPLVPIDPALAGTVDMAVADLATRLDIPEADIEVVSAEPVTWPDSSLGCPQTGVMYTQVLVEGARVILAMNARSRVFVYHAGPDGQAFLCPSDEQDGGHDFVPPPGFDI